MFDQLGVSLKDIAELASEGGDRTLDFAESVHDGVVLLRQDRQLGVDGGDLLPHQVAEALELLLVHALQLLQHLRVGALKAPDLGHHCLFM